MPVGALLLALAAAAVHAGWNLLVARADDPEAATAVMFAVSVVVFAPVAAATWRVEGAAVPYVVGSAALETVYVALLGAAYRRAQLSVVYPVARGLAPVLVLVGSVTALGVGASATEAAGVCVVGLGVLLVRGLGRSPDARGLAFGVAIAVAIATYTVVDRYGIRHANAVAYLELVLLGPVLVYTPAVGAIKGWRVLRSALSPARLGGLGRRRAGDERRDRHGTRGCRARRAGRRAAPGGRGRGGSGCRPDRDRVAHRPLEPCRSSHVLGPGPKPSPTADAPDCSGLVQP